jgi:hypothetical protein
MDRSFAGEVFAVLLAHISLQFKESHRRYIAAMSEERLLKHHYDVVFDALHLLLPNSDGSFPLSEPHYLFYGVTDEREFQDLQRDRLMASGAALGFDVKPVSDFFFLRSPQLWRPAILKETGSPRSNFKGNGLSGKQF